MKIFHCLNHFLPEHVAGTEVYVLSLCKAQLKNEHDVAVIIPNYNSSQRETYSYEGIPVVRYAEPSDADRSLKTGQRIPDGLKFFATYLKEEKPDIVHFHEIGGSNGITVWHLEAAKAMGTKVIFTVHLANITCRAGTLMLKTRKLCDGLILEKRCACCTLIHKTNNRLNATVLTDAGMLFSTWGIDPIRWQNPVGTALSYPAQIKRLKRDLKRIVSACDTIISLTHWYQNILKRNGVPVEKMEVIPQALPGLPVLISGVHKKKGWPIRLIFVGRIDPLKGIQLLVDVIKRFTPFQLQIDIYGNVIDQDFYNKCKAATASFHNLHWKGKLDKEQVVETMSNYDALILPSMFSEMSPFVIQEAFAAGIPVIGSNVYGIAEQVEDGVNGALFQFGDVVSLEKVLRKLVDDPEMLNRFAGNTKPVVLFKEVADATMKVYESVL